MTGKTKDISAQDISYPVIFKQFAYIYVLSYNGENFTVKARQKFKMKKDGWLVASITRTSPAEKSDAALSVTCCNAVRFTGSAHGSQFAVGGSWRRS